jgi:serine phosphatase RsbU (regulator of sigma subunit)
MQRLNFESGEAVDSDITEIRHLSMTLERMRSALQSFTSAREDLRVARSIRDQSLAATIPTPPGIDIEIWQDPAEELGGEIYDAVALEPGEDGRPGCVVMGVFDFSATGLAAAIGGVHLCAEFRVAAAAEGADVAAIAARLDRFVRQERPEMSPLHGCLLRLDGGGNLAVLGFGWDDLLHRRGGDVQRIALAETPLGTGAAIDAAALQEVRLHRGDLLVLASDGVLDALSDDRQRYRLDGLERALRASGAGDAAALIETVVADLGGYSAGIRGDRTLLVIRINDSGT